MNISKEHTEPTLAIAKKFGLHAVLNILSEDEFTYEAGLKIVTEYLIANDGHIQHFAHGVTLLSLNGETATCSKSLDDSNKFYFQI